MNDKLEDYVLTATEELNISVEEFSNNLLTLKRVAETSAVNYVKGEVLRPNLREMLNTIDVLERRCQAIDNIVGDMLLTISNAVNKTNNEEDGKC